MPVGLDLLHQSSPICFLASHTPPQVAKRLILLFVEEGPGSPGPGSPDCLQHFAVRATLWGLGLQLYLFKGVPGYRPHSSTWVNFTQHNSTTHLLPACTLQCTQGTCGACHLFKHQTLVAMHCPDGDSAAPHESHHIHVHENQILIWHWVPVVAVYLLRD